MPDVHVLIIEVANIIISLSLIGIEKLLAKMLGELKCQSGQISALV